MALYWCPSKVWGYWMKRAAFIIGILGVGLLIWGWLGGGPLLPTPKEVALAMWAGRGRLIHHLLVTVQEMGLALLLAFSVSFPLGWSMWRYRFIESALEPLFVVTQSIPMIALAPIMVLLFGFSQIAIILPTALMLFFPLTIALYQGFRSTPKAFLDLFAVYEATSWQRFCKLLLPWSRPHLLGGLRVALSYAAVATLAGEWAGGQEGLGVLLLEARRSLDMPLAFGALITVVLLTYLVYSSLYFLEKRWSIPR